MRQGMPVPDQKYKLHLCDNGDERVNRPHRLRVRPSDSRRSASPQVKMRIADILCSLLESINRPGQASRRKANHGDANHNLTGLGIPFVVAAESAVATEPAQLLALAALQHAKGVQRDKFDNPVPHLA